VIRLGRSLDFSFPESISSHT